MDGCKGGEERMVIATVRRVKKDASRITKERKDEEQKKGEKKEQP